MRKVGLVSCVKAKREWPAPAHDPYTSDWLQKARAYAERNLSTWYILSAKHHLGTPDEVLAPYDQGRGKSLSKAYLRRD